MINMAAVLLHNIGSISNTIYSQISVFSLWIPSLLLWYMAILIMGIVVYPTASFILKPLYEKGYPLHKILGIGIVSYIVFIISRFTPIQFNQYTILAVIALIAFLNILLRKYLEKTKQWEPLKITTIIKYEGAFLIFFLWWAYIRGHNPALRSLEKFMDLGFIQSSFRSSIMPPQDMWFAPTQNSGPLPINYYYFGHFTTSLIDKLSNIPPNIGYNFMLASIVALSLTAGYSIGASIAQYLFPKLSKKAVRISGVISAFLLNFSGNLHTIYIFTKGYPGKTPIPFWKILKGFNPGAYWYPNATRFIPFTIHEFPSYSHVVADLHGHLINLMNILLLIGLFFAVVQTKNKLKKTNKYTILKLQKINLSIPLNFFSQSLSQYLFIALFLAISYMTNATDFIVYGGIAFIVLSVKKNKLAPVLKTYIPIILGALFFTIPFSSTFKSFVNTIGINCASDLLVKIGKIGPFIAEPGKCQTSPFWMLAVLWGFFWIIASTFILILPFKKKIGLKKRSIHFIFLLFTASILLTFTAEFAYFKDIYPNHFRANTMFKLGYQAFIIMSLLAGPIIVGFNFILFKTKRIHIMFWAPVVFVATALVSVYSFFSIPSYYGALDNFKSLDGSLWIKDEYPQIYDVILLMKNIDKKNPSLNRVLLEAHGDSYTDYNMVSAHTGIPTVVGWAVHEWLWRGSYEVVRPRAQDVRDLYTSNNIKITKRLIKKYGINYVLISSFEKKRYGSINTKKWYTIGKPIYMKNETVVFKIKNDNL